jgi:hypothetical protein
MSLSSSDVLAPGASGLSRKWLLAGILGAVVLLFIGLSTSSAVPFRNDFAAYWPVGRLLLTGQNPYDAGAIEALQRSVGDTLGGDSVVRYPPWSLPLLLPFAALPYVPGWYLWIFLQAALVGVSSVWLWRMMGGCGRPTIPLAVAFGFPAGLFVAIGGQIGGVLLLGVSAFLWAILRRHDVAAGFFLGVLTLKPHLFIPLGIVAVLWAARDRRWRVPIVAILTVLVGCVLAVLFRPEIFSDYLVLLTTPGTSWQRRIAIGTAVSKALGGRAPWLQWVPAALISALVIGLWVRFGSVFDWLRNLPLVLVLGLLAAPYLLIHDLVLLVPAFLTMALCIQNWESPRSKWIAALAFAAFCVVVWIGQIVEHTGIIHVWIVPLMSILALGSSRCVTGEDRERGGG